MEFSNCYNRPAAYKKCGLWYAIPRQTNDEVKPMEEKNARKLKIDRTALNSKRREKKSEQAQLGPLMRALKWPFTPPPIRHLWRRKTWNANARARNCWAG